MGVLDDAIREHLELKRRHGASQGEVEQQEQEALGAPRPEPTAPASESVEAPAEVVEPPSEPDAPDPEDAQASTPAEAPEDVEPDWGFEPEAADPEPQTGGDTPPRGFEQVDDDVPPAESDGEEDVLEETPDFLQETPEHDRLWFEQKPPRDFDFDE